MPDSRKQNGTKIAILIPCFNEEQTIGKVIGDFRAVLPLADIYVFNNNSTDRTTEVAKAAGAIVRQVYQQGKGNVIRAMFREVEADCYLMIDGDDTYPAEYAQGMTDMILAGRADMVIGDRLSATYFTENKRPFHNLGNRLVRYLINRIYRSNVRDIMTGYRAFSRAFVKTFPVLSKGFEIETEMTIHALDKNFLLTEVPVDYRDRPAGSQSKLNTYTDGLRVLKTIFTLYKDYRPLSFFGWFSLILLLLSMAFFIPVLVEYQKTGLVERFPTLIVSGFVLLASLLSYVCGLILDVVAKKQRQQFELILNQNVMLERLIKHD